MDAFKRVKLLIGSENFQKLKNASVAVFGVGGVGGYCAEALARSGVGRIAVFDNDVVAESNLNRQIIATVDNIGEPKVFEIEKRLKAINPEIEVECNEVFYLPENADKYPLNAYDYVVDAVDTVTAKIEIIARAKSAGVKVISCMGTGGKLDPTMLKVANIEKTKVCPLARVMRRELKSRGINGVKVVYSEEQPCIFNTENSQAEKKQSGRTAPPSMIFVPATAGLILAKEVVFGLIGERI